MKVSVTPQNGDLGAFVTFEAPTLQDSGEVKVIAKNPVGEATAAVKLNVQGGRLS